MKITIVTCVKNEGPFLIEWIAYNRVIGVTDFLFYSNDCTDGTNTMLDRLASHGIVRHLPNPAKGRNYQMEALRHSYRQRIVTTADWVFVADVDEFLNIHLGRGRIADLIEACGNPVAISVPWQFMANSGVEAYEDRPVIEQFFETHNPDLWSLSPEMDVKTLVRRDLPMQFVGVHRPFVKLGLQSSDVGAWTDASGREVPVKFKMAPSKQPIRSIKSAGARQFATLNHYALRSMESYLVKNRRGDVNRKDRNFDTSYWQDRNDPARRDDSILRYSDRLRDEMARLLMLEGVRKEHDASVLAHRAAIADMRQDPLTAELLEQVRTAPKVSCAEAEFLNRLTPVVAA